MSHGRRVVFFVSLTVAALSFGGLAHGQSPEKPSLHIAYYGLDQGSAPIPGAPLFAPTPANSAFAVAAPGVVSVTYSQTASWSSTVNAPAPSAMPTPFSGDLAAPYQPMLQPSGAGWQMPSAATPDAPAIAPTGDGQTVGLFVGITNYQSGNNLPHCADDARRMAQAFVSAGIIASGDTVVLTDHQATRANLRQAINRLSANLDDDGMLVVFFSGHGNNRPDQNGDERDGLDETIVLADGSMDDDELTSLLQRSRGRELLALDSCHAGGFQADLARIPNSVGFYASREDQVSYVAPEHGAGGYLSHFMRTGVESSRGQRLEVGQLEQHVRQGFQASQASGRQDLVVGTGSGADGRTVLFEGAQQG